MRTYKVFYFGLDMEVEAVETLHNLDGDNTMMNIVMNNMEVKGYPFFKVMRFDYEKGVYENVTRFVILLMRKRFNKNLQQIAK